MKKRRPSFAENFDSWVCEFHGIMILLAQNPSQLTLSCHHSVMHYTEPMA